MSLKTTGNDPKRPANDEQTAAGKANEQRTRGVRCFAIEGRPSPYGVEWRVAGRRKTEWFATEADRDRRAAAIAKERRRNTLAVMPTMTEIEEFRDFKRACGATPWAEVIEAWRRQDGSRGAAQKGPTVAELVRRYIVENDERLGEGRLAKVTHAKNVHKARALEEQFGDLPAAGVSAEDIEVWIDDLGFEAAETFNTYRKIAHAVFEGAKFPRNVVGDVPLRSDDGEIELLTVAQTRALFKVAQTPEFVDIAPRLAAEAFAGLRFSSAMRLERQDVNVADKGIELPAAKLKTRRRHYIDGLPENLWAWMALAKPPCWSMTHRNYRRLKSACFAAAKVPHPHNCLRHSFASYHAAGYKDAGKTAYILCHRDQQLLWSTYKGRATEADGRAYFEIVPA